MLRLAARESAVISCAAKNSKSYDPEIRNKNEEWKHSWLDYLPGTAKNPLSLKWPANEVSNQVNAATADAVYVIWQKGKKKGACQKSLLKKSNWLNLEDSWFNKVNIVDDQIRIGQCCALNQPENISCKRKDPTRTGLPGGKRSSKSLLKVARLDSHRRNISRRMMSRCSQLAPEMRWQN